MFWRNVLATTKFVISSSIRWNDSDEKSQPSTMYSKWMEAHPKDIVWHNLDDGALEVRGRYLTSWAATVGLIIAWAFPVGFIGTLSNLSGFCVKFQ